MKRLSHTIVEVRFGILEVHSSTKKRDLFLAETLVIINARTKPRLFRRLTNSQQIHQIRRDHFIKMRLYDQSSSTPTFAGDANKWKRPVSFLPTTVASKAADVSPISKIEHCPRAQEITECHKTVDGSESSFSVYQQPSESGNWKEKGKKIFRFDIDDEAGHSMISSSKVDTRPTFQTQEATPVQEFSVLELDALCPSQTSKATKKDEVPKQEMSFQAHVKQGHKEPEEESLSSFKPHPCVSFPECELSEASNTWGDDATFRTPELTQTESSETAEWVEFCGDDAPPNPFRSMVHEEVRHPAVYVSPSFETTGKHQRISSSTSFSEPNDAFGTYDKYIMMLAHGVSITDVTKAMRNDLVDPSAISLMLTATWTRSSR